MTYLSDTVEVVLTLRHLAATPVLAVGSQAELPDM